MRISLFRFAKAGLFAASILVGLMLAETAARVYFACRVGPDLFYYGFVESKEEKKFLETESVGIHENYQGSYAKYYPYQERVDHDRTTGEIFKVRMNNKGFRGEDIGPKKPGVVRVLTLGASSTFGYGNRYKDTYPEYMEKFISEKCGREVEVINFGIPHTNSEGIYNLLLNEGLALEPDVVTLYTGANDTALYPPLRPAWLAKLRETSLLAEFIDSRLDPQPTTLDPEKVRTEFIGNIKKIKAAVETVGAVFVVANQMTRSGRIPPRLIEGWTYADEAELVARDLEASGTTDFSSFLLHFRMMGDLEKWARKTDGVVFVDAIKALDNNRDEMTSWVHLTPKGNAILAEAFSGAISVELSCAN